MLRRAFFQLLAACGTTRPSEKSPCLSGEEEREKQAVRISRTIRATIIARARGISIREAYETRTSANIDENYYWIDVARGKMEDEEERLSKHQYESVAFIVLDKLAEELDSTSSSRSMTRWQLDPNHNRLRE